MNWTKTIPTRPGAYWFRYLDSNYQILLAVKISDITKNAHCRGFGMDECLCANLNGEWCGPLVPVEEVEMAYWEGYKHGDDCLTGRTYTDSRARRVVEGKETT